MYLEELLIKELNKIKSFSLHKAASKVVDMTTDFVKVLHFWGCKQGCKVFGIDEPMDAVCVFCEKMNNANSKKTKLNDRNNEERCDEAELMIRAKQPIYYIEIKGQLKSFFVHPQSIDNLRYGKRYVSVPGVYHDIQDSENYKIISQEDGLCDPVSSDSNQLVRETFILYGGLMNDGYTSKENHSMNWCFTMFHLVLYSLSPRLRYVIST